MIKKPNKGDKIMEVEKTGSCLTHGQFLDLRPNTQEDENVVIKDEVTLSVNEKGKNNSFDPGMIMNPMDAGKYSDGREHPKPME
jgi:hypothetical protein